MFGHTSRSAVYVSDGWGRMVDATFGEVVADLEPHSEPRDGNEPLGAPINKVSV